MQFQMGDIVEYQGDVWEVGFVNQLSWKGTLRLQKSGHCDAKQINHVRPDEVELTRKEQNEQTKA